ncbi:MAG: hypothetical protein RL283_490 [Actinomycetota bacterium]|jgi:hypothetical protein
MTDHAVRMSAGGPPDTVLPAPDPDLVRRLADATSRAPGARRAAIEAVVARHPAACEAWAALGDASGEGVDAYAAYRVGYHRGLDLLRANGWRGSGFVRWRDESNRGFLRCLRGLGRVAGAIGDVAEAHRCAQFLAQLDPSGDAARA